MTLSIVGNALWVGFATSISLILAIGAQNAFVLRCGLRRHHIFWVCSVCAVSDALLIAAGINSMQYLRQFAPWLENTALVLGIVFLIVYGSLRLRSFWHMQLDQLQEDSEAGPPTLQSTLMVALALTWFNPHVYLDTFFLIAAVSLPFSQAGQALWFGLGAVTASFIFFFALGYGATLIAPVFSSPKRWRYVELAIGLVMWLIAIQLLWLLLTKITIFG